MPHVIRVSHKKMLNMLYFIHTRNLHIVIPRMHLWHGEHITLISQTCYANCFGTFGLGFCNCGTAAYAVIFMRPWCRSLV